MINTERILKYLNETQHEAFCDDCLSSLLSIEPRQQVNQICNKLSKNTQLDRRLSECSSCFKEKIVNSLRQGERRNQNKLNNPGKDFFTRKSKSTILEEAVNAFFKRKGINLKSSYSIPVGINYIKKDHKFDLGSNEHKILIECKSHSWTRGGNIPSAKMTIWNEAMYYFLVASDKYQKMLFVSKETKHNETLANYYVRTYKHLIPDGVEIWEYDINLDTANCLYPI